MKRVMNLVKISAVCALVFIMSVSTYAAWVQDGAKWKYEENGAFVVSDWREIDNAMYYFDENGYMATDLTKIGSNYHMFDSSGKFYQRNKEFTYAGNTYEILSKGKVDGLTDAEYEAYIKEKAQNAAFKAEQEALKKAQAESIAASKEAYKKEHAAEIAASEAAAEAEKAAKKEQQAKAAAEAQAKSELLISSENRNKLYDTVNRATARKAAVRNLVNELTKQLNERRSHMVLEVKHKFKNNEPVEFSEYEVLFNEVISEYADVADGILSALSSKFSMRDETYDDAVSEVATVLASQKAKFETDMNAIE